MDLAYRFSCIWRYDYSAEKCAIMVFGETPNVRLETRLNRVFLLGQTKVDEVDSCDHVGITLDIDQNSKKRTNERISKACRAFNALTGLGIRRGGVTPMVCSLLYWSICASILTYRHGQCRVVRRTKSNNFIDL